VRVGTGFDLGEEQRIELSKSRCPSTGIEGVAGIGKAGVTLDIDD